MLIHPRSYTLARFADGELEGEKAKRVATHLTACARCRATVASVRALGDAARASSAPAAGEALWARIAARRASGERVLPAADAREPARNLLSRNAAVAAAAVAAILIVASLGVEGALVASQSGSLTVEPARPRAGATVRVRYRPATQLAAEPRLVLRARFVERAPVYWDFDAARKGGVAAATLAKQADGTFAGALTIPDSAVYATFAVSDATGKNLDTDHALLWDLVVLAPDGRLSFDGLIARALLGRESGPRARRATDSLVANYPDSARSWATQVEVRGSSKIPHWLSVFDEREKRFAKLESMVEMREPVSVPEMEAMMSFARAVEDDSAAARWKLRLCAAHATDAGALVLIALWCGAPTPEAARAQLTALDAAWEHAQGVRPLMSQFGIQAAARSGDREAMRRWTIRNYDATPAGFLAASPAIATDSVLRAVYYRKLRESIGALLGDSLRTVSLVRPRANDSIYRRGLAAWELGALGSALARYDGAYAASRDTLDLAIRLSAGYCNFEYLHGLRAVALRSLGDTAAATADVAMSAASERARAVGRIDSMPTRAACFRWAAVPR